MLLDNNNHYLQTYRQADRPQRLLQAKNTFLSVFPRYAFETGHGVDCLTRLAACFAAKRVFSYSPLGCPGIRSATPVACFSADLQRLGIIEGLQRSDSCCAGHPWPAFLHSQGVKTVLLRDCIRLEGVHYRYQPEQPEVLRGIDLEIRRGERIGFIGTTGSGKSTTIDLLMGLLKPNSGMMLVDGEDLHDHSLPERLVAWRSAIAHVPQTIYLSDSSIAENIAFGVHREQIDMERVRHAASQAQIGGFIESSSDGYESFVGERGIRLSGGQRQRIGIARALYKQASILV